MTERWKRLLLTFGIASTWGLAVWGYLVFMLAYANGGQVVVAVDRLGEAHLELVVLTLVVTPAISVALALWATSDDPESPGD